MPIGQISVDSKTDWETLRTMVFRSFTVSINVMFLPLSEVLFT